MKGVQVLTRVTNVHSLGDMHFAAFVGRCVPVVGILSGRVLQEAPY
jgi:hypothetical protein